MYVVVQHLYKSVFQIQAFKFKHRKPRDKNISEIYVIFTNLYRKPRDKNISEIYVIFTTLYFFVVL